MFFRSVCAANNGIVRIFNITKMAAELSQRALLNGQYWVFKPVNCSLLTLMKIFLKFASNEPWRRIVYISVKGKQCGRSVSPTWSTSSSLRATVPRPFLRDKDSLPTREDLHVCTRPAPYSQVSLSLNGHLPKGPFTQAIFVAATHCNFCRGEVATSKSHV